jgi:putative ABC transport system permease protein
MTSPVIASIRLLIRDWRGGELGVLFSALLLAVSVVVAISGFVNRLQFNLERESASFLAADLVVSSSKPIPAPWVDEASASGLAQGETITFSSMVISADDEMFLASVKAVGGAYPLRGALSVDKGLSQASTDIPEPGTVFLAPRLVQQLSASVGDEVYVGDATLTVAGTLLSEPDSTTGFFGYGPRLVMNTANLDETGVVQPGSRVTYRLLVAGESDDLTGFKAWVEPQLVQGQRLSSVDESQPGIGATLDRARGFLLLAGSLGVMLAAAAILVAARRFGERHTDQVAVMKSLGATRATIRQLYAFSLAWLGLISIGLGSGVGWLAQSAMFNALAGQLPSEITRIGVAPYITGAVTAFVCIGFFAWPPLARLGGVSPLRVIRREETIADATRSTDLILGAASLGLLMLWYSSDWKLTAALIGSIAITVGLGFFVAQTLLKGSRQVGSSAGSVWRLALAGMQRRGTSSAFQVVIFAIAIMLLLVLTSVRTSLLDQWRLQIPEGTPNHFILNVAPTDESSLLTFFSERDIEVGELYPAARGRVMAVNGQPLPDWDRFEEGARQREANFTSTDTAPDGNKIVSGTWWEVGTEQSVVSLEDGFAEDIGAKVGDLLTLRIAADEFSVQVASIREVNWESMQPNFFVIFPDNLLERFPNTLFTSFYLEPDEKYRVGELLDVMPTLTIIELDVAIQEIKTIIDQVSQAIELVLLIILVAGALVLIAGVSSSVDERMHESAILRALGAGRGTLLGAVAIEFATMGSLAGILAILGSETAGWVLQTQMLDLEYQIQWVLWPMGIALGAVIIGSLGTYACRRVVSVPPLQVLREL